MSSNTPNKIAPIAIGYWKSDSEPDLPDPEKFIAYNIANTDRQLLLKYLAHGTRFMSYLGYSFCRFQCGIGDSEMGASCFTDGKYVWPEGLSHYITQHNVWLPKAFITHVIDNSTNNLSSIDLTKMTLHDYTWWKEQQGC